MGSDTLSHHRHEGTDLVNRPRRTLLLLAALLAVAALWMVQDNPDIDGTTRGDDYTCAAPYDTVLLDNPNVPGGEPPPDSDAIAARCREAGEQRFTLAVASGVVAGLVPVGAVVGRRRTP